MKGKLFERIAVIVLILMLACLALGAGGVGAQTDKPDAAQAKAAGSNLGLAGRLGEAIAQAPAGAGQGQINPAAPRGVLGIPGSPKVNYLIAALWAVWVGWIFSTVGAFGGIMAGVGHMTILGLGPYAKTFKQTAPMLNKVLTDSIRTSNQFLVSLSSFLSMLNYLRAKRVAWPLGLALGLGSVVGAVAIPALTGGKISFSQYQGWFGLFVFVIGGFLLYETTPRGQARKKAAKEAAASFEKAIKEKKDEREQGINVTQWGLTKLSFTFFGAEFTFNPVWAFLGGIAIASIAAFIGVGGGFLYVPFLTSVVGLPMFVVAGTSAVAVFISMVVSITTYLTVAGTPVDWALIGVELIGIFVGSMIGPRTQKYIPDIWLKRIFVVLALYVGFRYFSKGFFGVSWVPPY